MHREFDPTENPFRPKSHLPLYLFTAVVGLLLLADLWPLVAGWINSPALPSWNRTQLGFASAFALLSAVLGGARALFRASRNSASGKSGPTSRSPSRASPPSSWANRSSRPKSPSSG